MSKLIEKYADKVQPVSEEVLADIKKISAKYIFVEDKEGNAACTACNTKINVGHTKHKADCTCPSCGRLLNIQHTWRMSKSLEDIDWYCTAQALDENVLVLQYVLSYQKGMEERKVTEEARLFVCEKYAPIFYMTRNLETNTWSEGKGTYFRTPSWSISNRFFCLYAKDYKTSQILEEAQKLDCFKYYPVSEVYDTGRYTSQLHYLVRSARVNEKLSKIGYTDIHDDHLSWYMAHGDRCFSINPNKSSLVEMLKIDKARFQLFKKSMSLRTLSFLQEEKTVNEELFDSINSQKYGFNGHQYRRYLKVIEDIGITVHKCVSYLEKQKTTIYEWEHYLDNLKNLGYNLKDESYTMPKNFKKEDKRVADELVALRAKEREREEASKNGAIKQISEALRKMPNLKEFMEGSKGLMVYVPESISDLENEGRALHNCIGTYVDRIANNMTLVFYIRKLEDPTAPFVAMEYCHGEIIQCRYDHNKAVEEDSNIYDFCKSFAKALAESKVLAA